MKMMFYNIFLSLFLSFFQANGTLVKDLIGRFGVPNFDFQALKSWYGTLLRIDTFTPIYIEKQRQRPLLSSRI